MDPACACLRGAGESPRCRVRRDRLQLSTGQAGEGESKTWEEKQSEQPGCPYPGAASFTPCFPTAARALPTHPPSINQGGKAGDSALVPTASACTVCLHSSLLDFLLPPTLAFTDPQGATFLPICSSQSLVQPWPKGTESSASSLQQTHLLPFAQPSQLQSSAVISWYQCGAVHRNGHWAVRERTP